MDNVLVLFETDQVFRAELNSILSGFRIVFHESGDTSSIDAETAKNTVAIFGNPKTGFWIAKNSNRILCGLGINRRGVPAFMKNNPKTA